MADITPECLTGGCLCGALRYAAQGRPLASGYCFCSDCRHASGSGFVGFVFFNAEAVSFSGPSRAFITRSHRGSDAQRNVCALCSSLVFGGHRAADTSYTLYAGSLDDPSQFHPTIGIFAPQRPHWVHIPPGLTLFDTLPG